MSIRVIIKARPARRWSVAVLAVLGVLAGVGRAPALTLTGGPTASPPGGITCTQSELGPTGSAMTLTCTIANPEMFADLYFGMANTGQANGVEMNGALPSGREVFRYSTNTLRSITYTSATTVDNLFGGSAENVNSRLVLTLLSGSGAVIDTGGTPANNGSGDIQKLFRIPGDAFSVRIEVSSNHLQTPEFGPPNENVFNRIHKPPMSGSTTEINLGFYYLQCTP